MKRLLIFVLILTMLLPLCRAVSAADPYAVETVFGSDVEIKPFFAVATADIDEDLYPAGNITRMPSIATYVQDGKVVLSGDTDALVERIKSILDPRPDGLRVLYVWAIDRPFRMAPEDGIYLDEGIDQAKVLLDEFFEKYAASGAKPLDGVFTDLEYHDTSSWYIQKHLTTNPHIYSDIVNNPKYQTEVRPLLEEYDFRFYENPNDITSEIWGIYPNSGEEYASCRAIWDTVNRIRMNNYLNYMLFDTVAKYYPDAVTGDYQCAAFNGWYKRTNDTGTKTMAGNEKNAGNTSTYNFYASRPTKEDLVCPVGYNNALYKKTSFHMTLWDLNMAKNAQASTESGNFSPWITGYVKAWGDENGTYAATPYYSELLFHFGLLDAQPYQVYAWPPEYEDTKEYNENMGVISQILAELTRVAGAADRKPISMPVNWNHRFLLTGMYAGGRNIWRITPDTYYGMTVEAFKIADNDPTFYIDGQTVTFPQGKIIKDGNVDDIGTCGYWVETPTDVMPVITSDADRYARYPAFREDFESYSSGTVYNSLAALPKNCWEILIPKDSSAVVQGDKDKVLALTGDVTVKNINVPQNITAGDSYARQQAWEVTLTLPENLNTDASLTLLNASDGKPSSADDGLKITGGKVYCNGTEMPGVDLSAGGTYTIKRVVHFTASDAYTSDYSITDANGQTVGQPLNVAMAQLRLPVQSIGFSCENISEPVIIHEYKLYAAGITRDFELYTASNGVRLADTTQPQETDTAYRLSWMNALGKETTCCVVATYYKGNRQVSQKVVQEVVMAPYSDGVETGIAELEKDGHTLVVSLREGSAKDNQGPVSLLSNPMTLTVILAAALAVALIALALLIPGRKKTAPKEKTGE